MAQSSITLLSNKSVDSAKTGTVIGFNSVDKRITSSTVATVNLASYKKFDLITVTGASTASNNKTYTVKSDAPSTGDYVEVEESIIAGVAGPTITLTHSGFVSDKKQGDGYYSQVDGFHTVAYHVSTTLNDDDNISLKMQGSLATTPTEDDWFDINGTKVDKETIDGSTQVFPKNFTGNFVWVRAKITGMTTGTISKILYNH
jgi:hypothetical protein